jgi:ubiquinone/menaquinone biosynthesis C-methylase UbiE
MSKKDTIVDAFTELAPHYEHTMDKELKQFWGLSYREFVGDLVKTAAVNSDERVLDVATGTAVIPRTLVAKSDGLGPLTGLDITYTMLQYAREQTHSEQLSERISLVCASATSMPLVNDFYDVVMCGLGMHHMNANVFLLEMKRVLKPGGRLIMADVGASAFWRSLAGILLLKILLYGYGISRKSSRAQAEIDAFPNVRTKDEWNQLLGEVGFIDIQIVESPARRPWYPNALTIMAVTAD